MSTFDQSPTTFLQQNLKNIIIALIALAVLVGGFIGIQKLLTPADSYKALDTMVRPANPSTGKLDSNVELLYLYDYQCSACQSNAENMLALEKETADKLKITYKHFVVHAGSGDRDAKAAQAVNIVAGAKKFFEFTHALIKVSPNYPSGVPESNLVELVKGIGFDEAQVAQFKKAKEGVDAEKNVKLDQKDIQNATLPISKYPNPQKPTSTKPEATPTLVLLKDGKYTDTWWSGVLPVETVKQRIDDVIASK
jgi:protein-disulfide isomerase